MNIMFTGVQSFATQMGTSENAFFL